jgi:hypothetical protein
MLRLLFYSLLVLSTPVDDAFARATPEPEDDAAATANNDFLPSAAQMTVVAQPAALPGAGVAGAVAAPGTTPAAVAKLPFGPDPLFVFMSFQR